MTARGELERDVVAVACAISGGVHAALAPAHFAETVATGAAFAASAAVLALVAVGIRRPRTRVPAVTAVVAFAGLLASYLLSVTTGLPLLHPEREPIETLGLLTKAVEAVGLIAAARALRGSSPRANIPQLEGTLT